MAPPADYSHTGEVGLVGGAPATATSTSVTSSVAAGSRFGQSVQFTATVVPESGSDPTGSVSFFANGLPSAAPPSATSATAGRRRNGRLESAGRFRVDHGDLRRRRRLRLQHFARPDPGRNPDPTNLTITPSSSSPQPGQPVVDTATVSPAAPGTATPSGTVSFTDDGSPVTGCQSLSLPAVAPLQVSCTETYGSGATHSIVASYSGDADDAGSNASLLQAVGQVPTETTVASSSPTSTYGQSVTLTATVTPTATAAVASRRDGHLLRLRDESDRHRGRLHG